MAVELLAVRAPHRLVGVRPVPVGEGLTDGDAIEADDDAEAVEGVGREADGGVTRAPAAIDDGVEGGDGGAMEEGADHGGWVPSNLPSRQDRPGREDEPRRRGGDASRRTRTDTPGGTGT